VLSEATEPFVNLGVVAFSDQRHVNSISIELVNDAVLANINPAPRLMLQQGG